MFKTWQRCSSLLQQCQSRKFVPLAHNLNLQLHSSIANGHQCKYYSSGSKPVASENIAASGFIEQNLNLSDPPRDVFLQFDNSRLAYRDKNFYDLILAWFIFRVCAVPAIVQHADTMYKSARKIFGATLTDAVVRNTFFRHFCGGENEAETGAEVCLACSMFQMMAKAR